MQRRLYLLSMSVCLLSVLIFGYSCTDHSLPSNPPELKTLPVTDAPSGIKCGTYFKVDIVSVGTEVVKEYGVVMNGHGIGLLSPVPLVNIDYQLVFDSPFTTGEKAKVGPQVCTDDIYYRAYAILIDDTVVYGNTIHFTNH